VKLQGNVFLTPPERDGAGNFPKKRIAGGIGGTKRKDGPKGEAQVRPRWGFFQEKAGIIKKGNWPNLIPPQETCSNSQEF